MLKVEFKISTISIPRKAWFCDPSLYHFFCKKHPIWGKLGAFFAKFSKIHPILQIGRIGYVTITHPSIYQNLRKCTSKLLSIPVYHLSVRTPPPRYIHHSNSFFLFCFFFFWFLILPGCSFKCYHLFLPWSPGPECTEQFDCRDGFSLLICSERHISNGR